MQEVLKCNGNKSRAFLIDITPLCHFTFLHKTKVIILDKENISALTKTQQTEYTKDLLGAVSLWASPFSACASSHLHCAQHKGCSSENLIASGNISKVVFLRTCLLTQLYFGTQLHVLTDCGKPYSIISQMGNLFGRDRLTVDTISFGPPKEEFRVIERITKVLPRGIHQRLGLSADRLRTAFPHQLYHDEVEVNVSCATSKEPGIDRRASCWPILWSIGDILPGPYVQNFKLVFSKTQMWSYSPFFSNPFI